MHKTSASYMRLSGDGAIKGAVADKWDSWQWGAMGRGCHTGNTVLWQGGKVGEVDKTPGTPGTPGTPARLGTLAIGGILRGVETEIDGTPVWVLDFAGALGRDVTGKRLDLYIQDMSVPAWGRERWEEISELVRVLLDAGEYVLLMCLGGHGRSGMAAAIICGMLGIAEGDVVEWIRRVHCREAVETFEQARYARLMVGQDASGVEGDAGGEVLEAVDWGRYTVTGGGYECSCELCGVPVLDVEMVWIDDLQLWVCSECAAVDEERERWGSCIGCGQWERLELVASVGEYLCPKCRKWWGE